MMKGKNLQPRKLYPARLLFRFDGEIKSFPDKHKLREFSSTKSALQQMLRELLWQETQEKEKTYKELTQNNEENGNRITHIDNYLKYKWIKCTNQKT